MGGLVIFLANGGTLSKLEMRVLYVRNQPPNLKVDEMQLGAEIICIPASYRLTDVTDISALL